MIVLILIAAFIFLGGGLNLGGGSSFLAPHDNNAASGTFAAPPSSPGPLGPQWAPATLVPPPPGTFTNHAPPGAPPTIRSIDPRDTATNRPQISVAVRPSTGPALEASSGVGHF